MPAVHIVDQAGKHLTDQAGAHLTPQFLATEPGEALVVFLKGTAAVTAIVGSGDNARIRPDVLAQNETLEAIRYELLSTDRMRGLDGVTQLFNVTIQIDCYGDTRQDANTLGRAVADALDGHRGIVAGLFWNDVAVEGEFDAVDPPPAGSELWRRRKTITVQIVFAIATT